MTNLTQDQKDELERLKGLSKEKLYLDMNNLDKLSWRYSLAKLVYSERLEEERNKAEEKRNKAIEEMNKKQLRIGWAAVFAAWGSAIAALIQLFK